MDELAGLAASAGVAPSRRLVQERAGIDPAYYIGRGKLDEVTAICAEEGAEVVIVNDPLSPAQARNLQDRISRKILDRTQLILDIFAQRARTQEGKLQVELAQLTYLLPRLTGKGVELSRLGGGIGTRGPGEMKLEIDRRRMRQNIPTVALVGYTNAGKSTLFTTITHARTLCSPKLFATLDPLCRRVHLPGGSPCYLSDTVGFIRKLPVELVAAFRATLEEVVSADLLVHVCDVSSVDLEGDLTAVDRVLSELGAHQKPMLKVYNKCDLLPSLPPRQRSGDIIYLSALKGGGIDLLLDAIQQKLDRHSRSAPDAARECANHGIDCPSAKCVQ